MRRLIAALTAVAALLVAQPAAAQQVAGTIRLVSQTAWVTQGGEFALRLAATSRTPSELEVAVTVYPAVGSRSAFNESLEGRVTGSPVTVKPEGLSDLPHDSEGTITVRLPIQDAAQPRDPLRVRLRGAGVYPVAVELRETGGGRRVDRFTTHLIHVPGPVNGPRLATALVLPLAAPPAHKPDGTRELGSGWSSALRALVAAVDAYRDLPLTLVPQPETLQSMAASSRPEDREAAAAFSTGAAGRLVLAAPYVRLSEPAYADDFASEEAAQRRHGVDVVGPLMASAPDVTTAVVEGPLDDSTANRLADAQVERVVVRESALAPLSLRTTLTQPFELRGRGGRRLPAVVADDGLAAHFTRDVPPPLAAHQLLADLAVLYFDSPGLVRGAAPMPPPSWRASTDFLGALLDGVRSSPILLPVDAAGLFAAVPPATGSRRGAPLLRDAAQSEPSPLPEAELRRARRDLGALDGLAIATNPDVTALHERVLAGQSADLRPRQRSTYLRAAADAVRSQLEAIRVPPNQAITLTARRGEIPVTILRDVPFPVRVIVEVSSDRLQFPEGATARLDLARRNTTIRFTVQARTSGTFPLEVTLRSPDGNVVLSRGRFIIRSRAASGVGVILSVSAVVFLILWWTRHIVQVRRGRRVAPTA